LADDRPLFAGRYELYGLLGLAGKGSVYRARDTWLDAPVAIKILRKDAARAKHAIARFYREARIGRQVTDKNVVRVYDVGELEGDFYLTMELVEGGPLTVRLAEGKALELDLVLDVGRQLARGLEAIHAAGVIHGDLKPDNVLLAPDGRVVVTDFALAAQRDLETTSPTGQASGTPVYMSPEQIEGGRVDHRTDLHALGVVLYEMMTGAPPWTRRGDAAANMVRLSGPAKDPRAKNSDLPAELAAYVLKLLDREPSARPATARSVALALAAAQDARRASSPTPRDGTRAPDSSAMPPRSTGGDRSVEADSGKVPLEVADVLRRARQAYAAATRTEAAAAETLISEGLARAPDNGVLLAWSALALLRRWSYEPRLGIGQGAASTSAELAKKVIARDPTIGEAHLALAIGFDLLGQTADALRSGEASIHHSPTLDEAHFTVGRLRSECGEAEEGIRRLKLAARLDPKNARTLLALARACELTGDSGGADAWLALADGRATRRPEPALLRLQIASWRSDPQALRLARERLATVDASDAIAYRALALFSDDGDLAVGELAAAAAAIGAPARYHWEIMQLIAEQQAQSGDLQGALSAIKSALAAGCADFLWLDRCGAFDRLRNDPDFSAIRTATRRRVERAMKDAASR
jgi:hypothetical protein